MEAGALGRVALFIGLGAVALCLSLPWVVRGSPDPVLTMAFVSAAVAGVAVALVWGLVRLGVLTPAKRLAAQVPVLLMGDGKGGLPPENYGAIGPLAALVAELASKVAALKADTDRTVAEATRRAEEQSGRLAALLRDLHQGVLVCNLRHQVLLYNEEARALLPQAAALGLGRPLVELVTAEPVRHTLDRLSRRVAEGRHKDHREGTTAGFVAGTAEGRLLQGRMAAILGADESVTGYVVTLEDATEEMASLAARDRLLRSATEDVRAPLANLSAAAEMLAEHPELSAEERQGFEQVILAGAGQLQDTLARITAEYRAGITAAWPMADIISGNLFALVAERCARQGGPALTGTGLPCWLHGDSYGLALLLSRLAQRVAAATGQRELDLAATHDNRFVYADMCWKGEPLAAATVQGWRDDGLADALAALTVADILDYHNADLWSERCGEGLSRLRVPLPLPKEPHGRRKAAPAPRPEFFDFDLLHQPLPEDALAKMPLKTLSYVVFDTETTGLSPSQGDELVSVAGVRIVNGRILTGETFQSLVNPGRAIPAASTAIHGITDAMVADAPPPEQVLKQFRGFVGGAVLVAHNAAFDLKFLKMKQKAAGVRFDTPVLDTMVLSRQLQGEDGTHSLDGIAASLGVEVVDRHSALGDSLVTAAIFLKFLDALAAQGIVTLDDAIRRSNMAVELHARERAF